MHVFISQPMAGRPAEDVRDEREAFVKLLTSKGHTVEPSTFVDMTTDMADSLASKGVKAVDLFLMHRAIKAMSKCDAVFLCPGWNESRGCLLEHELAMAYGLRTLSVTEFCSKR